VGLVVAATVVLVQADLELLLVALQTQAVAVEEHIKQAPVLRAAEAVLLYYVGLQHNNEF
jgi:hypothetical protein